MVTRSVYTLDAMGWEAREGKGKGAWAGGGQGVTVPTNGNTIRDQKQSNRTRTFGGVEALFVKVWLESQGV